MHVEPRQVEPVQVQTVQVEPMVLKWRVLVDLPDTGPKNMAVDHALAACSSSGEAVLRIYQWSRPTVSFGRNELAHKAYDLAAGREAGMDFVRRPTGGRAVLHDRELTYAAVLPLENRRSLGESYGNRRSLRATYGLINRGLLEALRSLRVPATLAGRRGPPTGPDAGPCFDEPAPGEVTVAGRKLVGSAQARLEGAILQHGSLLIGPGQERLQALESTPAGWPAGGHSERLETDGRAQAFVSRQPAPISLEEVLGQEPPWHHLVEAVIAGLKRVTGGDWHRGELTEPERVKSMALVERYASAEWTWRR